MDTPAVGMLPFDSVTDFRIDLADEHELFRKSVRRFVELYVEPRVREIERSNRIPEDILRKASELGFTGLGIPEEYGGRGLTTFTPSSTQRRSAGSAQRLSPRP